LSIKTIVQVDRCWLIERLKPDIAPRKARQGEAAPPWAALVAAVVSASGPARRARHLPMIYRRDAFGQSYE